MRRDNLESDVGLLLDRVEAQVHLFPLWAADSGSVWCVCREGGRPGLMGQ